MPDTQEKHTRRSELSGGKQPASGQVGLGNNAMSWNEGSARLSQGPLVHPARSWLGAGRPHGEPGSETGASCHPEHRGRNLGLRFPPAGQLTLGNPAALSVKRG